MELILKNLGEIVPYDKNPRKNENAVDAVAASIQQCEYVAPIVVDENNVILAGHTRYKALKKLGYEKAEIIVKTGLTEEQKRKYRLLDNKTAELSDWDFDLLAEELEGLDFENLELDWELSKEIKERSEVEISEEISLIVTFADEVEAERLFNRLTEEGYQCRVSTL